MQPGPSQTQTADDEITPDTPSAGEAGDVASQVDFRNKGFLWKLAVILRAYYKLIFFILAPILLLPLPLVVPGTEARCGYMVLLLVLYWVTETLPLGATAFLPIVICPAMGLLTSGQVTGQYFDQTVLLLVGGLMVAIAIEASSLHRRLALNIIGLVGTKPQTLMIGFMFPAWFLSMWISNSAASAMLLTFLEGVIVEMKKNNEALADETVTDDVELFTVSGAENNKTDDVTAEPSTNDTSKKIEAEHESVDKKRSREAVDKEIDSFASAMTLSISYAAKVGGIACLTGTPTNIVMKGAADDLWREKLGVESPVQFGAWMVYSVPMAVLMLVAVYLWLYLFHTGCRRNKRGGGYARSQNEAVMRTLAKQRAALPPMSWSEVIVSVLFALLILLWFFRSPGFMPGWEVIFKEGYTADAIPALLIAFLFIIIPAQKPTCSTDGDEKGNILEWQYITKKFPWDVIFLAGGGNALAHACNTSGLSDWLGERLSAMGDLPGPALVLVLALCVSFFTEALSNMAACAILMPIMINMAAQLDLHPLYLMFPVGIACSFAFMLPNSSAASAVAFSYGRVTIIEMVKAGFFLNIFSVLVVLLANETWGKAFFNMNELPWSNDNVTEARMDFLFE